MPVDRASMLTQAEIYPLLPHAGDMVLIDRVESWTAHDIVCATRSHLRPDNPLRRGGRLSIVCAIEYGAQAMRIHGGLMSNEIETHGLLASLRDIVFFGDRLDGVDSQLVIRAAMLYRDRHGTIYDFSVGADSGLLLTGRASVIFR